MLMFEYGARAYPLRFTARSLLRTRERGGRSIEDLLHGGSEGAALFLYAALCDALPQLTLNQAQWMLKASLDAPEKLDRLLDNLARAYADSGFPPEGVTKESFNRLLDAAANAGYLHTQQLYDLTYAEIVRELNAYLAQSRLRHGLPLAQSTAMSDKEMQQLLISIAGRDALEHH